MKVNKIDFEIMINHNKQTVLFNIVNQHTGEIRQKERSFKWFFNRIFNSELKTYKKNWNENWNENLIINKLLVLRSKV